MNTKEYVHLCRLLKKYNKAYYNNEPLVTDEEYDLLYKSVIDFENKNKHVLYLGISPRNYVGAVPNKNKTNHLFKKHSLKNAYSIEDVIKFYDKVKTYDEELIIESKYDGINITLLYMEGILVKAMTRGDGNIGSEVTDKVIQLNYVPNKISIKDPIEISGEVIIENSIFENIDSKNPRNYVSGLFNTINTNNDEIKKLTFIPHSFYSKELIFNTYKEIISFFIHSGFKIEEYFFTNNINEVKRYIENYRNDKYPTDGIVIKINDMESRNKIGYNKKYPKWAIAYKFAQKMIITKIIDIKSSISKNGRITPVLYIEPITIDGTLIKKVNGYNEDYISKNKIKIGSEVGVIKSGGVIPKVIKVF